jgi:eukaryotic-like serine/threonine-protein kinase
VEEKVNHTRSRRIGRYLICGELAAGGMATVHIGRLMGPVGFARTVAIKRLHPQFAKDPEFVSMFLDEARLAARIRHPNVVPVLDVVASDGELFLVMDFVIGESISRLIRIEGPARDGVPIRIAVSILCGSLQGLHAAHETRGDKGDTLGIVHRDISPQNILLGSDGVARVIDFGIAKAMGRVHASQSGQLKGKLPYMAPEHVRGEATRQSDVFSSGVVLWELIAGKRLFAAATEVETFNNVLQQEIVPPSSVRKTSMRSGVDETTLAKLDNVVMRSLERDASKRFATAREFAIALEKVIAPASMLEMSEWMESVAGDIIRDRSKRITEVEELTTGSKAISIASLTAEISRVQPDAADAFAGGPVSTISTGSSLEPFGRTDTSHVTPASTRAPTPSRRNVYVLSGLATFALRNPHAVPKTPGVAEVPAVPESRVGPEPETKVVAPIVTVAETGPALTATTKKTGRFHSSTPALGHTAPVATPVPPPLPKPDCTPPFTIDANGRKHFKPNCF